MNKDEASAILHRILEDRGYLVVGSSDPKMVGTTITNFVFYKHDFHDVLLYVVSETTKEDLELQREYYYCPVPVPFGYYYPCCCRMIRG